MLAVECMFRFTEQATVNQILNNYFIDGETAKTANALAIPQFNFEEQEENEPAGKENDDQP